MIQHPTILWFRLDLRLADNPALHAAMQRARPILPVYIWAPDEEKTWQPGGASRWWLHHSLARLDADLQKLGSRLIIRRGPALETLRQLAAETKAEAVFWHRRYEPALIARDSLIKKSLQGDGLTAESFNSALLHEPWEIQNSSGRPFQVFTAFWKNCLSKSEPVKPLPTPKSLPAPVKWPKSEKLDALELLPKINWADGIAAAWEPGEAGAAANLRQFIKNALVDYPDGRNRPDVRGSSRLSPHLHFGEISPRQVWRAVQDAVDANRQPGTSRAASVYLSEIGWREFAHHLLFHFPRTTNEPLRPEFAKFPWRDDDTALRKWQRGRTGYPIVDAGMRELWATGWMHNRVRMIVASFLTKDLLIPWQEGAKWFWDTLVDADLASNTLGWQWTAGCGADAAPYFRVFNPVSQGNQFDPEGEYVRRWVPELAKLPAQWIHLPWEASADELSAAKIVLGKDYPKPMVDHGVARQRALAAWEKIRR